MEQGTNLFCAALWFLPGGFSDRDDDQSVIVAMLAAGTFVIHAGVTPLVSSIVPVWPDDRIPDIRNRPGYGNRTVVGHNNRENPDCH